mgnify:CR=1 FL=1
MIIENNKVLLIKRTKPDAIYWVIPGGGAEDNETKEQALIRECREELGVDVDVKELLLENLSERSETEGQAEYFYLCVIKNGSMGTGSGPEFAHNSSYVGGYDIEYRDISDLKNIDLKPGVISDLIYNKFKM